MIIITGQGKAFAAGADIREMSQMTTSQCLQQDYLSIFNEMFQSCRKPIIAAVNGYAVSLYIVFNLL